MYRLFLYTGRVTTIGREDQDASDDGRSEAHSDAEWTKLAHCYLLGKSIRDQKFANASITAITEKMDETDRYPTGLASEVYAFTTKGDNLRQLIVDVHVWKGLGQWIRAPHDDTDGPAEFMQDVLNSMATEGASIHEEDVTMPWDVQCAYHVHGRGEVCDV